MGARAWIAIVMLAAPVCARADSSVRSSDGDRRVPPNVRIKEPLRPHKSDVDDLLHRVAVRVHALAARRPQLRRFDEAKAIVLFNPLHRETLSFQYGVTEIPNPDFDRLTRERLAEPRDAMPVLRSPIPKTVSKLTPDAIAFTIDLYPDGGLGMQRMFIPIGLVGEIAIELRLEAGTDAAALGEEIRAVVVDEILRTNNGHVTGR